MSRLLWVILFIVLCSGCVMTDRYQACLSDEVCRAEINQVRDNTYLATKTAASTIPMPSVPELLAFAASNIVAFVFGVGKGKRKA